MGQIEVFSPAKINLFLAVLGRMESGFHELVSLVAPLDFGDAVRIEAEPASEASVALTCSDQTLPVDRKNLAFAAAEGFLLRSGLPWKVTIHLEKRIPHGAGLGGGSSNASSVLKGLCDLALAEGQLGLSKGELLELAAELGSDCPLFLERKSLVMRGRGEQLFPVTEGSSGSLKTQKLVLFKPSFSIGTAWAYNSLAAREGAYDDRLWAEERLKAWQSGKLDLADLLHNSFERVACEKYAALETLFAELKQMGIDCLMSGSGSCCFALVSSDSQVESLQSTVKKCWGERVFFQPARVLS